LIEEKILESEEILIIDEGEIALNLSDIRLPQLPKNMTVLIEINTIRE